MIPISRAARARRRSWRAPLVATVVVVPALLLSGCDPQKAMAVAQVVVPVLVAATSRGGAGLNPATLGTSLASLSGVPSGSMTGVGPATQTLSGGLPQVDTYATPPSVGANPGKAQIGQLLDAAAQRYGIPADILKGVAYQESGWRADASSFDGGHGKGVMQIDDRYHQFAKTQDVWDPAKNIDYGARYLRGLYDKSGSWEAALKSYNGSSAYPPKVLAHASQKPWAAWA